MRNFDLDKSRDPSKFDVYNTNSSLNHTKIDMIT